MRRKVNLVEPATAVSSGSRKKKPAGTGAPLLLVSKHLRISASGHHDAWINTCAGVFRLCSDATWKLKGGKNSSRRRA